jgi:AbrB family looped-hinge helix DNA binding protein
MKRTTKKFLVTIGCGHQITIPKEIREALKLKVGDHLEAILYSFCMELWPLRRWMNPPAHQMQACSSTLSARLSVLSSPEPDASASGYNRD